jgi:hypothetical protein
MKNDPSIIYECLSETYDFAELMMANATYMQKELPNITMTDDLLEQLNELCHQLSQTKNDLINEILNCHELVTIDPDSLITERSMNRIVQLEQSPKRTFHACMKAAQLAIRDNTASPLLGLLLMEVAVNIFQSSPEYLASLKKLEDQEAEDEPVAENDEDQECSDDDPNCYAFYCEDYYPIGQLIDAIHSLTERSGLSAETLASLKVFHFAMRRLPLVTHGVRMSLGLRLDLDSSIIWIEIRMGDGEFSLGRGSWEGGEAHTDTAFLVSIDYREGDAFDASQFAESFAECAEDRGREVVIEDNSDQPFTEWDLPIARGKWSELPCSYF